ncbi:MAG: hypothetical protein ACREK1_05295 [Longimicrobiales bacterium]
MSNRLYGRLPVLMLALMLPACSGNTLGSLGDILSGGMPGSGGRQGQISVEIRQVGTQQQVIQVATQDGQTGNVYYDQNTVVTYRQQQYPVTALEPGDLAVMQVQETAQGSLYASRIDVQTSVQERSGQTGTGDLRQYNGRISQIDHDRGLFTMQLQNGTITASLPYNAPQATVNYFHQLRVGDTIRIEATTIGTGRVEIYRFL